MCSGGSSIHIRIKAVKKEVVVYVGALRPTRYGKVLHPVFQVSSVVHFNSKAAHNSYDKGKTTYLRASILLTKGSDLRETDLCNLNTNGIIMRYLSSTVR